MVVYVCVYIPYCYLFLRELNFAKMGKPYFTRTNLRDLKGKYTPREFNFVKWLLSLFNLISTSLALTMGY